MAEYNEYQRRRNHTTREKKQKSGYGKKLIRQLVISVLIFAAACTPAIPSTFKQTAKAALHYKVNTDKITTTLSRIFENAVSQAFNENEENSNELIEETAKNL